MQLKDHVASTLSSGVTAAATSWPLTDASRFPDPAFGIYWVRVWNSTDYADPSADPETERVRVIVKTGNTLTVVRGTDSEVAFNHNTGGKTYTVALLADKSNIESANCYSVRSFGAKGDGTTDDTAAIQSAIQNASAIKVPVYFPAGTYLTSSPISLHVSSHLVGGKNGVVIKLSAAVDLNGGMFTSLGHNDLVIENITLDGNRDSNSDGSVVGLALVNSSRVVVRDCVFQNMPSNDGAGTTNGIGIRMLHSGASQPRHLRIERCYFLKCVRAGIEIGSGEKIAISDCDFDQIVGTTLGAGVAVISAAGSNGIDSVLISGCTVRDSHKGVVLDNSAQLKKFRRVAVRGCEIEGEYDSGANGVGIEVLNASSAGAVGGDRLEALSIEGCLVSRNWRQGIKVTGTNNVLVSDCTVRDNNEEGVWFSTSCRMFAVRSCQIHRNGRQGIRIAKPPTGGKHNFSITDCHIFQNGTDTGASTVQRDGIHIEGDATDKGQEGIISGCWIGNNSDYQDGVVVTGATQRVGLSIAANAKDIYWALNRFEGNTSVPVEISTVETYLEGQNVAQNLLTGGSKMVILNERNGVSDYTIVQHASDWRDVDISAHTGSDRAKYAFIEAISAGGVLRFRKKGTTPTTPYEIPSNMRLTFFVEVNDVEIFEARAPTVNGTVKLLGYIT